jgi:hypothetical protein
VIRWLENVPATFWGVLAGSFFTLLGVWLTNRAQGRRLDRQLEHERTLKSEERESRSSERSTFPQQRQFRPAWQWLADFRT